MSINKKIAFLLGLILALSACQTVEKRVLTNIEEERKIKEWEEYMNFIGEYDLSIGTVLRLTEEYLQAKDVLYKRDMDEHEKNLALYQKGQLKVLPKEPVQDYSQLINRFKSLAKHYRYGRGADAIQYVIGFALYEHGKREEAAKLFEELVKTYPKSDYLLEVSFRLGEFYYETGQMGEALEAYKRMLNYRQSLFYEKALYKIGWIHYKLDDFAKSADSFVALVDMKWSKEGKQDGLTEEALSCAVMGLTHFKETKQSVDFLNARKSKGYIPSIMMQLGEKLAEDTRFEGALVIYKTIEEWFPDNPELAFIYDRMAYIYDRMADEKNLLATDWDSIHKFHPSTPWYKKNYPGGIEKVDTLMSKKMVAVSKKYHISGKKEGRPESFERAIEGYRIFLSSYPASPEIKNINLLLAEALFDSKRYAEAAEEYKKTALRYPPGAEKGDIAFSALLAYEVIFYLSEKGSKETIEAAASIIKGYESDLAKNGKLENATYKLADMYSQAGAYDKARESIAPLIKGKDAVLASQKTAELYLKENNLAAAEVIYARLVEKQGPQAFKEALASIRYRMAEDHAKGGRFKDATVKFNETFSTLPGSRIGEAALVMLGNIYLQKKEIDSLEEVTGRIIKNYPASKDALSLMVDTGRGIEREEPLRAARIYEGASAVTRDPEVAIKLVLASAMLYEGSREYQKAETLFIRYLKEGKPSFAGEADVRLRLGGVQMRTGKKKDGVENLNRVVALEGKVEDRLPGKARLLLVEEKESVYLGLKLAQPFEETLQKKTELLDGLFKDYTQIAKYKVPELLPETFFRMGTALENFKESMIQSERPGGMTKDELEEYSFLLEERAYPYEEQSVKAYEKGLTAGGKNMINSEWVDKSVKRLAALRPALYRRELGEKGPELLFTALEPVRLEKGLGE